EQGGDDPEHDEHTEDRVAAPTGPTGRRGRRRSAGGRRDGVRGGGRGGARGVLQVDDSGRREVGGGRRRPGLRGARRRRWAPGGAGRVRAGAYAGPDPTLSAAFRASGCSRAQRRRAARRPCATRPASAPHTALASSIGRIATGRATGPWSSPVRIGDSTALMTSASTA